MRSHVSMEQKQCVVCGKVYDTNAILLDRRLQASMEWHTITGNGLCPEHQKMHEDGYVALVAIDPSKCPTNGQTIKQEDAYRTGEIAHLARRAFRRIFNVPLDDKLPMVFVEPAVIAMLKEKAGIQ